jgi:hypothetical protein
VDYERFELPTPSCTGARRRSPTERNNPYSDLPFSEVPLRLTPGSFLIGRHTHPTVSKDASVNANHVTRGLRQDCLPIYTVEVLGGPAG